MSVFNSVGTPLVVFMIIVMIGGAIFGISISGADYLNPAVSQAEASRIDIEGNHARAVYEQNERILKAQTEVDIAKINIDANAYQQQVAQNLAHQKEMQQLEWLSYQRMTAAKEQFMIIISYGLSFAVILTAILLAGAQILKAILSTQSKGSAKIHRISHTAAHTSAPLDPWRLPQYRNQMIRQARENEQTFLQAIKDSKSSFSSRGHAMTEDEYRKLPRAE